MLRVKSATWVVVATTFSLPASSAEDRPAPHAVASSATSASADVTSTAAYLAAGRSERDISASISVMETVVNSGKPNECRSGHGARPEHPVEHREAEQDDNAAAQLG